MAGAIDGDLRKFHASLNVSDLSRSVAFYRVLLGVEPAKVRKGYAKFDLAEPPLVLSLIAGHSASGGNLNHVGLRVRTAEELIEIQHRLESAGLKTEREEGVECCHARQTKFWIADPDRALWEVYVFHEDADEDEEAAAPKTEVLQVQSKNTAVPRAWEHHLRDAIPARVPHDDNSLHEIRLEGSINAAPAAPNRTLLFAECHRALRPGASIYLHGLAGDGASVASPKLPGPASAVQHVPASADIVDELRAAGFADVRIETLSEKAYFVVDDVPMREIRVAARKSGHRTSARTHQAIYLGPMAQVVDDFGNVFRRGVPTPLNVHDWQALGRNAPESFLLVKPEPANAVKG